MFDRRLIEVHIHVHVEPDETDPNILKILNVVQDLQQEGITMAIDLSDLTAKVEEVASVDQSAITLLQGLKAALDEAGVDPAALSALSASLGENSAALAAAVAANTPAVVETPPVEEPPVEEPPVEEPPVEEPPVEEPVVE